MENNSNAELIEKARQAKSPEELLTLAKENEITLSEEEAKAYFEQMNKTGELADNELENVAGGGCHAKDGRLVVTTLHFCNYWRCRECGEAVNTSDLASPYHSDRCTARILTTCKYCKFVSYENGLWLCNKQ